MSLLGSRAFSKAVKHDSQVSPITLSPKMMQKASRQVLSNIDLMVCDMAGTTVQEGGIVYKTLRRVIEEDGIPVTSEEFHPWHGAKKEQVIEHFARAAGTPEHEIEERVVRVSDAFVKAIDEAYFSESSEISRIDNDLLRYINSLQSAGIKVAFDTGYPQNIQEGLIKRLGFTNAINGYISSYEVKEGRPYPYMVHRLMERLSVMDVKRVCKVGDSVRDIEEGRNAGCGLVVGVLSGADDAESLLAAGADIVVDCVTDLPVPTRQAA